MTRAALILALALALAGCASLDLFDIRCTGHAFGCAPPIDGPIRVMGNAGVSL